MKSMMKYSLLSVLMAGAMGAGVAQAAQTDAGTLTITGNVVDSTCSVALSNNTFDFGDLTKATWDGVADKAEMATPKDVSFTVTGCPSYVKNLHVTFDKFDPVNDGFLVSEASSAGAGVQFGIADEQGKLLPSAAPVIDHAVGATPNWAVGEVVNAKVGVYKSGATFTAGDVTATTDAVLSWD
jgi:type 1 fimbria pilin